MGTLCEFPFIVSLILFVKLIWDILTRHGSCGECLAEPGLAPLSAQAGLVLNTAEMLSVEWTNEQVLVIPYLEVLAVKFYLFEQRNW